jgi:hypothetical protein
LKRSSSGSDGRQGLAFEEFQEGAATGGDVAHVVGDVELGDGRQGVAAAGDGEGFGVGDGRGHHLGAAGELGQLEHADRAVPDDGAGVGDDLGELGGALRADVEDAVVGGTSSTEILLARARAETSSATTTSVGRGTSAPRAS